MEGSPAENFPGKSKAPRDRSPPGVAARGCHLGFAVSSFLGSSQRGRERGPEWDRAGEEQPQAGERCRGQRDLPGITRAPVGSTVDTCRANGGEKWMVWSKIFIYREQIGDNFT